MYDFKKHIEYIKMRRMCHTRYNDDAMHAVCGILCD